MTPTIISGLQDFQRILGICPCCGHLFRLSETEVFYARRPAPTWYDKLLHVEARVSRAEENFEERRADLQARSREAALRRLRRELPRYDPVLSCHGYYPKDAKCLFDPVDFVIFHGLHVRGRIQEIVLLDHPPQSGRRERIQASLERTIRRGNIEWRTIRVGSDGTLGPE